jgi:hypothetical protein
MADTPKQDSKSQDIAKNVIEELGRLLGGRGVWESHWEECARYVLPAYGGRFNANSMTTPGAKKTQYQYDTTAVTANVRFAAVMESMLTPRNSRYQRVVPSNKALKKSRAVMQWFEQATDILFQYRNAPKANFAGQNHQNYTGLGAFGTGALFIDKLASEPGLRYKAIHLGEVYFSENHQGIIDRALRRFTFTARQAVQKWPDKCPKAIVDAAEKTPEREFHFIHCVRPRGDRDPVRLDYRGMEFASYYVSETEQTLLEESGYRSFPYAISRYVQAPGELYGRSPAMECLAAIKVLNEQQKTILKQGHRTVDPVLLAHDDGVLDTISLKPGSIVAGGVNGDGRPLVHTLPVGNLAIARDLMDPQRVAINDAFLTTLFQILTETPSMTATEVLERTREKGMLLSPTMGRQQSEYLGPLTERELDVLMQQGLLPPMPPELIEAKGDYTLEYDSPLSRAAKAEEAAGLMRTIEMSLQVVNVTQNPEPLDFFDWDVIVPEVADIQAVPMRWMKTIDAVQAVRAGRKEQQDMQTAIQAGPSVAAMAKAMQPGAKQA